MTSYAIPCGNFACSPSHFVATYSTNRSKPEYAYVILYLSGFARSRQEEQDSYLTHPTLDLYASFLEQQRKKRKKTATRIVARCLRPLEHPSPTLERLPLETSWPCSHSRIAASRRLESPGASPLSAVASTQCCAAI